MSGVFISYNRDDRALAWRVQMGLRSLGVAVVWDESMPSTYWQKYLKEKILELAAVVVLWTPNSEKSQSVEDEARLAKETGKLVNLLSNLSKPPWPFDAVNGLPLSDWDGTTPHRGWRRAVETIDDCLAKMAGHPPGAIIAAFEDQQTDLANRRANIDQSEHELTLLKAELKSCAAKHDTAQVDLDSAERQVATLKDMNASKPVMAAARAERDDAQAALVSARNALAESRNAHETAGAAIVAATANLNAWLVSIGAQLDGDGEQSKTLTKAQIAKIAREQAAKERADQLARDKLAAQEKEEADRLIRVQRTAGELAAAKAKADALAREKAEKETRERARLTGIAQEEERQRIADERDRVKRDKVGRQRQNWAKVRGFAKRYWMVVFGLGLAGLLVFKPNTASEKLTSPKSDIASVNPISAAAKPSATTEPDKLWLEGDWAINQAETGCAHMLKISLINGNKLETSIKGKADKLDWKSLDDGRIEAQNKLVKYVFRLQRDKIMVDDGAESEFSLSKCKKL